MKDVPDSDAAADLQELYQSTRLQVIKDFISGLLSHHTPRLYGHCIRVKLGSHSLYLCGRCTGLYLGLFIGIAVILFAGVQLEPPWLWFSVALCMGLFTVTDWMTQRLLPRKTTVRIRFATGIVSGAGLAIVFLLRDLLFLLVAVVIMFASVGLVTLFEERDQHLTEVIHVPDPDTSV